MAHPHKGAPKLWGAFFSILAFCLSASAQETYKFASRDTCDLYMDIFRPAEPSSKPAILHVFGGGFITGQRSDAFIRSWADILTSDGYTLVTVDYRLGMKGYKVGKGLVGAYKAAGQFYRSQEMGVEDVVSALGYICDNADSLRLDPANIVLAGSSAGAIITLATVKALANGEIDSLPEGFALKGAMSFAGAIIGTSGAPKFKNAPCPLAMFHGTADKAVAYDHLGTALRGIWGSSYISRQLNRKGYSHCIYRFTDYTHDVAAYHIAMWPEEKLFLEQNIIQGQDRRVDATLTSDAHPHWTPVSLDTIYN